MKIIKLHTTASTNSFLKNLVKKGVVKNATVVVAEVQTQGRGQRDNSWCSEPYKNLTFSLFVPFYKMKIYKQVFLNFAISLALLDVLNALCLPKISIKWPNDILSQKQKICGILIENKIMKGEILSSIIGIGLNVNQVFFSEELKNVTSLKNILKKDFVLEDLLHLVLISIEKRIDLLESANYNVLKDHYLKNLFRYKTPSMFKNKENELFMGKIIGISKQGELQIQLNKNEEVKVFGIKEVSFIF